MSLPSRTRLGRVLRGHGENLDAINRTNQPGPPARPVEDLPWFRFKGTAAIQHHAAVDGDPTHTSFAGLVVWDDPADSGWELVDVTAAMATRPAPYDTELVAATLPTGVGGAGTGLVPPLGAAQVFAAHLALPIVSDNAQPSTPVGFGGLFGGTDGEVYINPSTHSGTHALLTGWAPFCCLMQGVTATDGFDASVTFPVTAVLTRLLHFDHYNGSL